MHAKGASEIQVLETNHFAHMLLDLPISTEAIEIPVKVLRRQAAIHLKPTVDAKLCFLQDLPRKIASKYVNLVAGQTHVQQQHRQAVSFLSGRSSRRPKSELAFSAIGEKLRHDMMTQRIEWGFVAKEKRFVCRHSIYDLARNAGRAASESPA